MLLHYLGKLKNQNFALFMHVRHVSNVTFYHLSNRYLSNVMKTSAKINTVQNINIFAFCSFTVLNKLKALQLSSCNRLIDHQAPSTNTVKMWHDGQKPLEPKTHEKMQIVCKSFFFTKGVKMSSICTDTYLETLSPLVNCSVLSEIGP